MRRFIEALFQSLATLAFMVIVIGVMVVLAALGAILIPAAVGGLVVLVLGAVIWDYMSNR